MYQQTTFRVAIVGGGLSGLLLGIALKAHGVPFTLYESRASFTEIGAGINLGPSAVRSLRLINASLGEKIYNLATRNPQPEQDLWMRVVYGAPRNKHADAETIFDIHAPPTGSMPLHRQELLAALAEEMGAEHAVFKKKFVNYGQDDDQVTIEFADGTHETASILVACDGIHSQVRECMFGADNIVSKPHFHQETAYRAVLPMDKALEVLGESARKSTLHLGPDGYFIRYPVSGGTAMNCGAWVRRETWEEQAWVIPKQKQQLEADFKYWGDEVRRLTTLFAEDTSVWAAFQHMHQPDHFHKRRVILIGDAAHSMVPHQGAGASQAAEDAYVLAEILSMVNEHGASIAVVEAGLTAVDEIRRPRFLKVQRYSSEARDHWNDFWGRGLEGEDLQQWKAKTNERVEWIFNIDMAGEAEKAKTYFLQLLSRTSDGARTS